MDLQVEFSRVIGALRDAGIEYAVCGGLAVAIHGAPRATKDIDLLVLEGDLESVLETVRPLGYRFRANLMRFPDGMRIQRVTRIDGRDLMTVDLLLVGEETREAWESRRPVETGEGTVSVIGRDALIALKIWAGRAQDLADVERLSGDDR